MCLKADAQDSEPFDESGSHFAWPLSHRMNRQGQDALFPLLKDRWCGSYAPASAVGGEH